MYKRSRFSRLVINTLCNVLQASYRTLQLQTSVKVCAGMKLCIFILTIISSLYLVCIPSGMPSLYIFLHFNVLSCVFSNSKQRFLTKEPNLHDARKISSIETPYIHVSILSMEKHVCSSLRQIIYVLLGKVIPHTLPRMARRVWGPD